nr:immunoglobulin heavy chain junction region [Macaca mulatta]MOW98103.1 immunoglobulin heavy chain junction region [Macaca mulatta]MOW98261.1 immunoglobulin heavy chain junction region [Macaca mulatta]MOW98267.1 immunoglobulin heavy chain junction region [Macaca mulatta]MOW98285.1 immunoglobulin heavy chain junction region [Macaca mulatta]
CARGRAVAGPDYHGLDSW